MGPKIFCQSRSLSSLNKTGAAMSTIHTRSSSIISANFNLLYFIVVFTLISPDSVQLSYYNTNMANASVDLIIVISLFSYEAIKVISKSSEFWRANIVVPVLSLSVFFTNMRETSSYGLLINKKTGIVGLNVVISAILNIALNLLLIPKWNITGAAVATALTQFVYWSLNYSFSQKEYFIPYEQSKVAMIFITGALISFLGLLVNDMSLMARLFIKSAAIISFPFLLYLFRFYEPVELEYIKGFANKWSKIGNLRQNLRSLKGFGEKQ